MNYFLTTLKQKQILIQLKKGGKILCYSTKNKLYFNKVEA
jgi:hypothetical protein